MARISIEDDKASKLKDELKNLDQKKDEGRLQVNTRVFESGIKTERFFENFKEAICEVSRELLEDMKTYRNKIEEEYNCKVEIPQHGHINIQKYGNGYDYRLGENRVELVNGENLESKHCPECSSTNYHVVNFADENEEISNFDQTKQVQERVEERKQKLEKDDNDLFVPSLIFNICDECGLVFSSEDIDRRDKFDQEKIEEANRIGRAYRSAFTEAHSSIVKYIEVFLGEGTGEWVTEYGYRYDTGAITVDMPSMPKNPKDIDISINQDKVQTPERPFHPDVRMWKGLGEDHKRFPLRYRKLLDELATINGSKVKILGYKLNFENAQFIALLPNPPEYKDGNEVKSLSDPITPVYGHGYTVETVDKEKVRDYLDNQVNREEKVENEMDKYEKAVFVEVSEDVEVEEK